MKRIVVTGVLAAGMVLTAQAHFMSVIWPQKKMEAREIGPEKAAARVLVAGISSEFKDAVTGAVLDTLLADSVRINNVNLKNADNQNPKEFDAVFLVNTCIGWNIDNRVRKMIEMHPDYDRFVVFTTSGDPDSCYSSDKLPPNMDGVTSASVEEKKPAVVDEILVKIRSYLSRP